MVAVMHLPVNNEGEGESQEPPHLTLVRQRSSLARQSSSVHSRTVYRRRRLVVTVGLVVVALAAVLVLRAVLAGLGGGSLTTAGSSGAQSSSIGSLAPVPAAAHIHVVQPGETLWSIALSSTRGGDPRPIVDQLQQQLDGHALWVGQHLVLP